MLRLLLIRHAQSVGNAEGRMMGRHDALTALGRQQAQQLAERLGQGPSPTRLYASPLQRAAETAKILQQAQQSPPPLVYLDDLQEFQNGVFAGLTWAEASSRYPELCQRLTHSHDWIPIPGAETLQSGRDRADRVMAKLLTHQAGEQVWVVSHQWLLQHLLSALLGCDRTWEFPLNNAGLIEIWLDRDRWATPEQKLNSSLWQIRRFNDVAHLGEV